MMARGSCAHVGEGKRGKDMEGIENRRTDRQTDGRCCLFFCQSQNSQIYFICNEQMAPEHRTQTTLPTHAMYTADIDGEAL